MSGLPPRKVFRLAYVVSWESIWHDERADVPFVCPGGPDGRTDGLDGSHSGHY